MRTRPDETRSFTVSGGRRRSCSVRAARSRSTGSSSEARRSRSERGSGGGTVGIVCRRRTAAVDLSATIHLLGEALGGVLREQESVVVFETEERIRALAKARRLDDKAAAERLAAEVAALSDDAARAIASAFAVYFDLVNLAEETHRIAALRERERSRSPAPIAESVREAVGLLAVRGTTP